MDYQHIKFELADRVATITLNRPQALNAFTLGLLSEFRNALDRLASEDLARVLILTGAGRAFSAGADISGEHDEATRNSLDTHYNPLIERLYQLPIPIISAVNGVAAGVGCSFALAGDIVVAARSAYFLEAFVNIGLVPDGGATWLLPRLIGKARAQAMMMLGERIPAQTAEEWGMIYRVVDDQELAGTVGALARKMAEGPTLAYTLIRRGLREALECGLSEALQIERRNQGRAHHSNDFKEGRAAFGEKRPPRFQGN